MTWIEWLVEKFGAFVATTMPEGMLKDLVGVGSVLVFLPNILILYLFISLLEDSGYMARAAFIMDKLMHKIGLHGKSFIPMIMGFGCNVPAIMATRTIENHKSRLVTMLIIPMMSCAGRLPVYILVAGAFFPRNGSLVLLGLYALGIRLAGAARPLCPRHRHGHHLGQGDEPLHQGRQPALRHGTPALPSPDLHATPGRKASSICTRWPASSS